MEKHPFFNSWLRLLLKLILRNRGFETRMTRNGHLSPHLFSSKDPIHDISLEHFIRILINYAMLCEQTEKTDDFLRDWTELGSQISTFANSQAADELNKSFTTK